MEKTILCEVKGCGIKVATESKLKRHMYASHKRKKELKYHCNECPKVYDQQSKLKLHVAVVHRGERPFKCNRCDYTARSHH